MWILCCNELILCVCLSLFLLDSTDRAAGCRSIPLLLDAPSYHCHVGGIWRIPSEWCLLRVPHHVALFGLRQLLRQPHPICLPLWELSESLPASLHLPSLLLAPAGEENSTDQDGEFFHHTLHHQFVRERTDKLCEAETELPFHLKTVNIFVFSWSYIPRYYSD